jgi:diacylglycerol kinase (ATP)
LVAPKVNKNWYEGILVTHEILSAAFLLTLGEFKTFFALPGRIIYVKLPAVKNSLHLFFCSDMKSPHKHQPGITHAWRAMGVALQGLRSAFEHEDAFRQELLIAAIAIPVALFSPANTTGKAVMVGSILLVLIVELLNSALEATVDHTSLEPHPLAKRAKDIASAAVFLSIVNAIVIWVLILFV